MTERSSSVENLNFSQAMQALAWGKSVTRKDWPAERAIFFSDEDMEAGDWISVAPAIGDADV